ncbi:class I SAM-dependent methyltransferase [Streptoalloteichus tenebrarius]|uniref:class I SAM-dependent methyltransferase n=1 Tax=Streptoalloteichus tenebrarius (strain ATCC 17920 / DSM 40477 / JCM 4838 / CBS 697.72 / NBRC 16177 / NCIMB 11028 / NRRL B-12390 / A12253. 1 / ISP 5477) TaxID=1933 RepID=UPI0020A3FFF7|nr:class I SAM-dependent methyltransferase [Streptoalloteichus tenebrarius]
MAAGRARALGVPTRGTTNPNRLRRVDRWVVGTPWLVARVRAAAAPLVVDLGYGSSPVTTVEMADRLRVVRPDLRVLGLEIDPERVAAAEPAADPPRLEFRRGGFELAGRRPVLVRAFNVLRQYTEEQAAEAWRTLLDRLGPGGVLVEGTCDEIGRRCCWVTLDAEGPRTLTLACRPSAVDTPSDLAERLPKALIHRNVPGERVHALLTELDACWATAAPFAPFGPRARWTEAVRLLAERGWPVLDGRRRWRLGELTLPWSVVAPC